MALTLGEKLKQAREAKNISLIELQEKTKIQLRYLEAIEQNQFDTLPGDYNTKLFLRAYAKEVGLDPEQIIREYKGAPIEDDLSQYKSVEGTRTAQYKKDEQKSMWLKMAPALILTFIFLLVVGSVGYVFVKEHNRYAANTDVKEEYTVDNKVSAPETHSKKDETSTSSTTKEKKKEQPKMSIRQDSISGETVTLTAKNIKDTAKIVVTGQGGRCWMSATANGQSLFQGVVEMGQAQTLEIPHSAKKVSIRLGNAPMVSVELNGKKVDWNHSLQQATLVMNLDYLSE